MFKTNSCHEKTIPRQAISSALFLLFLFPVAIAILRSRNNRIGSALEHLIVLEVYRLSHYAENPYDLYHWWSFLGTKVDLVVDAADTLWAIAIKSSPAAKSGYLSGEAFSAGSEVQKK